VQLPHLLQGFLSTNFSFLKVSSDFLPKQKTLFTKVFKTFIFLSQWLFFSKLLKRMPVKHTLTGNPVPQSEFTGLLWDYLQT